MKALVHHGTGERGWDSVDDAMLIDATDITALKLVLQGPESVGAPAQRVGAMQAS